LWFLSRRFDFDSATLHRAIAATFERRETSLDGELLPFTLAYANDAERQAQWQGFLARNSLNGPPNQFPALMRILHEFIAPALQPNTRQWNSETGWV